jgi:hypothetical protein
MPRLLPPSFRSNVLRPAHSPLLFVFLIGLGPCASASRCSAQTASVSRTQTGSSATKQADDPSQPESQTGARAESYAARFPAPAPRPQTLRPQNGERPWEREGRQRMLEARGRLWAHARNTRDGYAETRRRLREPAAEPESGAGNPDPTPMPATKAAQ